MIERNGSIVCYFSANSSDDWAGESERVNMQVRYELVGQIYLQTHFNLPL
jgi:hypothetical protein